MMERSYLEGINTGLLIALKIWDELATTDMEFRAGITGAMYANEFLIGSADGNVDVILKEESNG